MPTDDEPRAVEEGEWEELRAAVNRVFRPHGGDLTRDSRLLFDSANRENLRVITRAGDARDSHDSHARSCIVAHAGFVTREALVGKRRIRVACIGAVFTAPLERGQGLATRVLRDALERARRSADLVLASGDRGLYRRQGLAALPPLARFSIPAREPRVTSNHAEQQLREAREGDLDAMAALYDAEDVHFVRPPADWRRLWGAGRLVDVPATFSVLLRGGRIVAYAVAQQPGQRADGSPRPRRILEIAGDRGALLEAAPRLGDELLLPAYDAPTIALCEHQGWVRTTHQLPITAETLTTDEMVIPWYGLNYL